jgi:hypothetical protein
MGNQFTNIFSNYKLERVKNFGLVVFILEMVVLCLPFCLVKISYSSSFCLTKRKQNSRQNEASAHRPLRWPAVLPGRGFFYSFKYFFYLFA